MVNNQLNYRGEHLNIDPDHVVGPDQFGCCYRAVGATYDPSQNVTAHALLPIPPAELQERGRAAIQDGMRRTADAERITRLFQGAS